MSSPLIQHTLKGNADCVEFCPYAPFQDVLACATYTLDEPTQTRHGILYLLEISKNGKSFSEICQLEVSGIFDLRWSSANENGKTEIALACADGSIYIYSLSLNEELEPDSNAIKHTGRYGLSLLDKLSCDEDAMCLSLDWNEPVCLREPVLGKELVCSLSNGYLCSMGLRESHRQVERKWKGHEFEAWIASYDKWKHGIVYSGADDCNFCGWDLRSDLNRPIFRDRKTHTMGVCNIQSSHLKENTICTGSYDEILRLWDIRNISSPLHECHVSLGGGIWRLKFHPNDPHLLLAACMHNGFSVIHVDISTSERKDALNIVEEYKMHASLAYGASWRYSPFCADESEEGKRNESLIATCSFYDKLLHLWSPRVLAFW